MLSIYSSNKTSDLDDTDGLDGFNAAMKNPPKKTTPKPSKSKSSGSLDTTQQRNLENHQRDELMDLLRFHVLDMGCQHIRGELFMSNGELDRDIKCAHPIDY